MILLDTNVLSHGMREIKKYPIYGNAISSITASEFLSIHSNNPREAKYYIPIVSGIHTPIVYEHTPIPSLSSPKAKHFAKKHTDQIILDFGKDYPTIIEYGSAAISTAINKRLYRLYLQAIQLLPKDEQKYLKKSFRFILESDIQCIPITNETIELAFNLLYRFVQNHNIKDNFRNSISDILILSTTIRNSSILISEDSLLNRFACEVFNGKLEKDGEYTVLDFQKLPNTSREVNKESKGYINRGWQVSFRKGYV